MKTLNAKQLRASLPRVVRDVGRGARFTVLYRSRPAFQIVPIGADAGPTAKLEEDPLYKAAAVGRSADGLSGAQHDAVLYGG